ncbi:MAG: T9SS type A sorting domain-containing protein [Bacteroidota bacterium]
MSRFFFSVILLLAGSCVSLNAQVQSFWRLTYGDTSMPWRERPELMNPSPIQGDWSLDHSTTYVLRSFGRLDAWDHEFCDWTSPFKMTVSYSTTLIDFVYVPRNEYTFDNEGRILQVKRWNNKWPYIENKLYNSCGQMVYHDLLVYDSASLVCGDYYELAYSDDGDLLWETSRLDCDKTILPGNYDSVAYVYDDERKLTDRSGYSGIKGEPLIPQQRVSYSYDSFGRLSEERSLTWMPETNSWFTEKLIDYQYGTRDRLSRKITTTYAESGSVTLTKLLYSYSDDGLETVQTGHLFQDNVWMENYYLREVMNESGQPVVIEEFHRDTNGNLYVKNQGRNHGFSRLDTDLRGRCTFTYDDNGLLKSFSNYSSMDQPDSLPNMRRDFYWKPRFSGKDDLITVTDIRIYPNPITDQITIALPNFPGSNISIEILDSTGKVQTGYTGLPSGTEIQLPVTSLAPGIYFARIVTDGKVQVFKLIKN